MLIRSQYIAATEFISAKRSKGEVLVFRHGALPAQLKATDVETTEKGDASMAALKAPRRSKSQAEVGAVIQKQTCVASPMN
jgi:hypothetical protein